MANSFKKMIKDGTIKRRDDGMYIRLGDVYIEEGFNDRLDDDYTRSANEEFYVYIKNGGQVPAMEVIPRDDGGVWIREGHRRTLIYNRLKSEGEPIEWVAITPCKGNNIDQIARVMSSASQLKLRFFEEAGNVKKLLAFNLTATEIAEKTSRSISHINKLIRFIEASHDVQTLARTQSISLDLIIDRLDSHGTNAGEALAVDVAKAKEQGKKRATPAVAQTRFTAANGKRLAELLSDATHIRSGEHDHLVLRNGVKDDVMALIALYMKE